MAPKNTLVSVPVWQDMAPTSEFLTALRESRLPKDVPYHLFFSHRGGGFLSTENTDGAVTLKSQLDPSSQTRAKNRLYAFDSSHTGILSDKSVIRRLNELFARARQGAV